MNGCVQCKKVMGSSMHVGVACICGLINSERFSSKLIFFYWVCFDDV